MDGQAPPSVPKVEFHTAHITETAQMPALIVKVGKIMAVVGFNPEGFRFTDVSKASYVTEPIDYDRWEGVSPSGSLYEKIKNDHVFYWCLQLDKLIEIINQHIGYICDPLAWKETDTANGKNRTMTIPYKVEEII